MSNIFECAILNKWRSTLLCGATAFLLLAISIPVAIAIDDSHVVNRCGALIAALGAIVAATLLLRELHWEKAIAPVERIIEVGGSDPLSRLEAIRAAAVVRRVFEVRRDLTIGTSAMIAAGELIHGWGDLLVASWIEH